MRAIQIFCQVMLLAACTNPGGLVTRELQPTSAPTRMAEPSALPTPTAIPVSSTLLARWNLAENRHEILPVDPTSGDPSPGFTPIALGNNKQYAPLTTLSADSSWLSAVESRGPICDSYAGGSRCYAGADVLHLVELSTWRERTIELPGGGWIWPMAFNTDNSRLGLAYNQKDTSTLLLIETSSGIVLAHQNLMFVPKLMAFTKDGAALALYGVPEGVVPGASRPGAPVALSLEATSLEILWEQSLEEVISGFWCMENCETSHEQRLYAEWSPAVAFSPDGMALYIVHADVERLTTVDFTAEKVSSLAIQDPNTWLERLIALNAGVAHAKGGSNGATKEAVISPDGRQLYLIGRAMTSLPGKEKSWHIEEELGLQVIGVESGQIVTNQASRAERIRITPDGTYLLLEGWGPEERWTEVLERASLKRVARLVDWEVSVSRGLDRQLLALASRPGQSLSRLAVLDTESFKVERSWTLETYAAWVGNY